MEHIPVTYSPFILVVLSVLIPLVGAYTFFEIYLLLINRALSRKQLLSGAIILGVSIWSAAATSIISIEGGQSFQLDWLIGSLLLVFASAFLSLWSISKAPRTVYLYVFSGFLLSIAIIGAQMMLDKSLIGIHIFNNDQSFWLISGVVCAINISNMVIFFYILARNVSILKYWLTLFLSISIFAMNYLTLSTSTLGIDSSTYNGYSIHENNLVFIILSSMFIVVGILLMISQFKQKQWENQAAWKNVQLQSLFKQNPDGIIIFNKDGRVVSANPASCKITGFSFNDSNGQEFTKFISTTDIQMATKYFKESINGKIQQFEILSYHKNGRELMLRVQSFPIMNDQKITGIYVIFQDMTALHSLQSDLMEKEEHYRLVSENMSDLVSVLNNKGKIEFVSPSHQKILGYPPDFLDGLQINHFIHPDDFHVLLSKYKVMMKSKEPVLANYRLLHQSGHYIPTESYVVPILDEEKQLQKMLVSSRDITERKKYEEELLDSETKYRVIAEYSYDLIRVIDPSGIVRYASPSHESILGYSAEEIIGAKFNQNIHPDDFEEVSGRFYRNLKMVKHEILEYRMKCKGGEWIWVEAHCNPVYDTQGYFKHYVIVSRNISERKAYEAQLEQLAFYDLLTEIPNRRLFQSEFTALIDHASANNGSFALFLLDCDRFKWVNDTFGHDTGDALLRCFVRRIKKILSKGDIFARLGGDEFAIILTDVHLQHEVEIFAKRMVESLQKSWEVNGHEFVTTSSIGISLFPKDGNSINQLMAHADQALYQAKEFGRNNHQYYSLEMEKKLTRKLDIENGLKTALKQERFHLVYQPQVLLSNGEIIGVEVLLRYTHPDLGPISPAEFIPLCEQSGMIDEVTHWVLSNAFHQQKLWEKSGFPPLKMAINISPITFEKKVFVESVERMLVEFDITPELIEFEITEDAFMHFTQEVKEAIVALKSMGIHIALDDFGSGYSSLKQLKELPIDKIKIDRTFIQNVPAMKRDQAIIESILSLTLKLNNEIICEGIETKEQVDYLLAQNCLYGQGYYFSRPLLAMDLVENWLEKAVLQ
ncbi:EAL domain-containing protein [Falsibacillus albus]|uniref:EAL domain-containing protein n=1 Tax=Falsibacillus albus TaxID=2478915 RepID=A0A3L7K1E4_9BACI|nr:EAL domain-containing protein [Falsibacillus albus]RLQ96174.1 EAL domain-containing protein [Falsibacillus albus]